mgnify:FL=1
MTHACYAPKNRQSGRMEAIDYCMEDEHGHFDVSNDEYGSYVNFCPFCGEKAPTPIPLKPEA